MTTNRAATAMAKLVRLPALAIAHKVARLVPFRPLDGEKLLFLRFDGIPSVPMGMLRGRVTVRCGTDRDLPALAALQHKPSILAARFASGDHCVVALADGRIVGYEWFCDRAIHHESEWGYPIVVPPGSVYAYDAYVERAFRNCGVWLRFKAYLGDWMRRRNKRTVITFVEDGNVASWRTHLRFGFQPAETVIAIRVFGITCFRVQPAASIRSRVQAHFGAR